MFQLNSTICILTESGAHVLVEYEVYFCDVVGFQ